MIAGYTDRLSSHPGRTLTAYVSCGDEVYRARTLRLHGGEDASQRNRPYASPRRTPINAVLPGQRQPINMGSYLTTTPFPWVFGASFAFSAAVFPTVVDCPHPQAIATIRASAGPRIQLLIVDGLIAVTSDDATQPFAFVTSVAEREWGRISVSVEERSLTLSYQPAGARDATEVARGYALQAPESGESVTIELGGGLVDAKCRAFNGKIADPTLVSCHSDSGVEQVLKWDFAADPFSPWIASSGTVDVKTRCVNGPLRAVTGPDWDGRSVHHLEKPNHYNAIHFHEDDLTDAGWLPSFQLEIDSSFDSGVYAFHLQAKSGDTYLPFVVTDAPGTASAEVLVVLPTWTYIAYANWRTYAEEQEARARYFGETRAATPLDLAMAEHPEFGLCFYDAHADGTGVRVSSRLRPIVNLHPLYCAGHANGYRHLSADLLLIRWLKEKGFPHAVATDDDLHEQGTELLNRYKVVLTGSHPEYCSYAMLDAYGRYVAAGGRLMYLGGNGFYWVTSCNPEQPHVLEMRRGHNGVRRWDTPPGEEYHSSTGELGGLWRYRGRPPHSLTGVGFVAQGFDHGSAYLRSRDSYRPEFAWVFDGVADDPFGLGEGALGGPAGDEIDAMDTELGTPSGTVRLASSVDHSDRYLLTIEDIPHLKPEEGYGGSSNEKVRSDIVLVPHNGEFNVFSVGSIAWINALGSEPNGSTARVTENVLHRFLS